MMIEECDLSSSTSSSTTTLTKTKIKTSPSKQSQLQPLELSNENSNQNVELCHVCQLQEFQYQCPRCAMRTCSLQCCKQHKETNKCNGKRDKTKFIPLCQMSDSTLQSDYHFLESICTTIQTTKRSTHGSGRDTNKKQKTSFLMHQDKKDTDNNGPLHPLLQQKRINESGTSTLLQLSLANEQDEEKKESHNDNGADPSDSGKTPMLMPIAKENTNTAQSSSSSSSSATTTTPLMTKLQTLATTTDTAGTTTTTTPPLSSSSQPQPSSSPLPKPPSSLVSKTTPTTSLMMPTGSTCPKTRKLVSKAKEERGITLMMMPPFMERHKNNTTYYNTKQHKIYWKVDYVIVTNTNTQNDKDNHNSSSSKDDDVVQSSSTATPPSTITIAESKLCESMVLESSKQMQSYFSKNKSQEEYHYLIKQLPCPSNQPRYVMLPQQGKSTLQDALRGMTIIEYPTIYLVPNQYLQYYPQTIQDISSS